MCASAALRLDVPPAGRQRKVKKRESAGGLGPALSRFVMEDAEWENGFPVFERADRKQCPFRPEHMFNTWF